LVRVFFLIANGLYRSESAGKKEDIRNIIKMSNKGNTADRQAPVDFFVLDSEYECYE